MRVQQISLSFCAPVNYIREHLLCSIQTLIEVRRNDHKSIHSWTPIFRTRITWSPRYFKRNLNSLRFPLMFSVIYYQPFHWYWSLQDFFHLIKLFCFHRNLKHQCTYWRVPEMCSYTGASWALVLWDWAMLPIPTTCWPLGKWKRRNNQSAGDSVVFFKSLLEGLSCLLS